MAGDTNDVRVWLDADVYVAPYGTARPANTTDAMGAGWTKLGLLSEDGLTQGAEEDSADHWAWGGILVRTVRTKRKATFTVAALQDHITLFQLANPGSEVESSGGVTVRTIRPRTADPRAWCFHLVDGDVTMRLYVPKGEATVGDRVYSDSAMTAYELNIVAYSDLDDNGLPYTYQEVTDDPQADDGS